MTNGSPETDEIDGLHIREAQRESVAEIVHELRNPLGALRAYTQLLKSEAHGPHSHPKYEHYISVAHDAAEALLRICDRLLIDETDPRNREIATEPAKVAERAVRRYTALAEEKEIRLSLSFSPDFPALPLPASVLEDALGNLITNAIKFTPAGGSVSVIGEFDPKSGAMIMVVRDSGSGMSPEQLAQVQKFRPVQSAPGLHGETGTGRGLAITKKQLEPYGVDIEIKSNPLFGTSVTLVFERG